MRPFWARFVRHAMMTGISLAVIGYLLARGFLMAHRIYGGGAYNPENERVLWQTPLVMAVLGIAMTGAIDLATGALRRPAPVRVVATDPTPPSA
jgi:hypothetical protein